MKDLRCAWGGASCPVYVAGAYRTNWMVQSFGCSEESVTSIYDDSNYVKAKKEADIKAAEKICEKIITPHYIQRIKRKLKALKEKGYGEPLLVAPCKSTSNNRLAIAAADLLSKELGIQIDHSIQQKPSASRGDSNPALKLFAPPEFEGPIENKRLYIPIDDMITTGATLAELRSHIVTNGGHVAFTCSLASSDALDKRLDPSPTTLEKAKNCICSFDQATQDLIISNTGIRPNRLTDGEAHYFSTRKGRRALRCYTDNLVKK